MGGEVDETRGRVMGRPWFLIGLALVVAATIPLVLADDVRYMRLGIVAALWAALIGAFLAVRYRRQATTTEEVVAQAQEVYELELEREIAARREFELEVEAETRQRVEAESRSELDALRAEIASLRDNLQNLFGGEVLLERVALTAQATRMRSLNEEQRVVESGVPSKVAQIAAARKEAAERPTEFIERVREKKEPVRVSARPMAPEPRRAERSMDLPPRRTAVAEPVDAERTRVQPAAKKPERPQARPVESTRPVPSRPERIRGQATTAPVKRKPEPVEEQTQVAKALGPEPAPRPERQASDLSAAFPTRTTRPVQPAEPKPAEPPAEPESSAVEPVAEETAVGPVVGEQPVVNETLPVEVRRLAQQGRLGRRRRRAEDDEPVAGRRRVGDEESPAGRRRAGDEESPAGRRRVGDDESVAGRRRRPERDEATPEAAVPAAETEPAGEGRRGAEADAAAAEEAPVGRRHRPDGEPPSWMSTGRRAAPAGDEQPRGSRRAAVGDDEQPRGSRRAAVDDEQPRGSRRAAPADDAGSHSNGRSVNELLAANGKTATPRRRRRAED